MTLPVAEKPEKAAGVDLDLTDRQLLNVLQSQFPLVRRPYLAVAEKMSSTEAEIMDRIKKLRKKNVLRQIGAIFDTRRIGYHSTLVAMKLPPDRIAQGARIINEHAGVSHNYERNHPYNLWFTLAVAPNDDLERTVAEMARRANAKTYRILPTLRFFKVGVNFDMVTQTTNSNASVIGRVPTAERNAIPLEDDEIAVIKELQEDLPLELEPFAPMADRLGMSIDRLFEYADNFMERGLMRRYSAVLHHRRAGFRANAMAVWRVPDERAVEVGEAMAESSHVSHCYQRPTYPDWPYSLFTMLHATSQEQCKEIARDLAQTTGVDDYLMLFSTREFKKTRVRYFV